MAEVILIRGLPGSGKSTLAKSVDGLHLESDQYWGPNYEFDIARLPDAHADCFGRYLRALNDGIERIVVSNTFTQRWEISPYILAAAIYNRPVEICVPSTPWAFDPVECYINCVHRVPLTVICKMLARWEEKVR